MRVKAISNPTTVIVEDPMGQCKKTEWEEQISDLRNVTKGDNL